ncbi:sulfite exporter TauE/SafE family protein [Neptuniibacter pectenicola]|uniref:Probable membrane transporter protein n=1 Tax=Neptuniibacter pectenicola TaxID=1806669 RepID=A0ABU9TS42_9GAMM
MFDSLVILLAATIFLASVVRTATGFGFALIAIPILSFFLEPVSAVAITMLFQTASAIPIAFSNLTKKEWNYAMKLLLFSLTGLLPGVAFLIITPPIAVQLIVTLCIFCALFLIAKGVSFNANLSVKQWVTVGFISGFMHGLAGASGPPILAVLHADTTLEKRQKRQIMSVFFLFAGTLALIPMLTQVPRLLLNSKTLTVLCIAMFSGMYIGQKLFNRLSATQFRFCTLVLMLISGLLATGQLIQFIIRLL